MQLEQFIKQVGSKIEEYNVTKNRVKKGISWIESCYYMVKSAHLQIKPFIESEFQKFKFEQQRSINQLIQHYQSQYKKQKKMYQLQIEELNDHISRQYKVISHMKQEVQDLMSLVNEQSNGKLSERRKENIQQFIKQKQFDNHKVLSSFLTNQLDIIEEESQTDRTIMSKISFQQSNDHSSQQSLIKIQELVQERFQSLSGEICSKQLTVFQREGQISFENELMGQNEIVKSECVYGQMKSNRSIFVYQNELQDITNQNSKITYESNSNIKLKTSKNKKYLEDFRKVFQQCFQNIDMVRKNSNRSNLKQAKSYHNDMGGIQKVKENEKLSQKKKRNFMSSNSSII